MFDVTSLFTNRLIDSALECLNKRWIELKEHTLLIENAFLEGVKIQLQLFLSK